MDVRRILLVLAVALAGAITIPLDRPGVGWAIAGVGAFILLRSWFGLIAVALLGIGAVRSAGWLFALCVVTAMVVLAATVVNGRTWRELVVALPKWAWAGFRGVRSVAVTSDRHGAVRLARGIGIGIVLVIVFGLLLGSAEQRFADLLRPLFSWPRMLTFAFVAFLCLGALHLRGGRPEAETSLPPVSPALEPGLGAPMPTALAPGSAVATPVSTTPVSTTPVSTTPVSTTPVSTTPVSTTPVSTTVGSSATAATTGTAAGEMAATTGTAAGEMAATTGTAAGEMAATTGTTAREIGASTGPTAGEIGASTGTAARKTTAEVGGAGAGLAATASAEGGASAVAVQMAPSPVAVPRNPAMPTSPREAAARIEAGRAVRSRRREWGRLEWAIPVALVDLLFATFAIVQFSVLFGGHDHVLDPHGPTYAEYARGGFGELATVTVLTLAVVAVVLSRIAPADGLLARVLIGLLCGLTLVIVASALRRMQLLVEAFGFTRTRLLATAFIVWLGLILLLLLAIWRRAILPRLTLFTGALVLLCLAVLNPDRIVAQTVIGRWKHDRHLDAPYLASLSLDALPALEALPEPKRSCIAAVIIRRHLAPGLAAGTAAGPAPGDAWNEWNAARDAATDIVLREEDCAFYLTRGYRMEGNWTDPSQSRHDG